MSRFRTLDGVDVKGKRALVRVDFNVPVENGKVADASRIERSMPTVKELAGNGAKVVLLAHFDRPKGKRVPEMSLKQVMPALDKALGKKALFADDCIGDAAEKAVAVMKPGDVLLLENTRYHAGEEKNDAALAAGMAKLGDLYVNDAFSAAHRAHASTEGIARLLPSYAGRLMQAELEALDKALHTPERPVVAIVGGAKVSTKIELLENPSARSIASSSAAAWRTRFSPRKGSRSASRCASVISLRRRRRSSPARRKRTAS